MGVALTAGIGAKAPSSWATIIPEDLVDGGTVLIGQGGCVGCSVTILLGVWRRRNRKRGEEWNSKWAAIIQYSAVPT